MSYIDNDIKNNKIDITTITDCETLQKHLSERAYNHTNYYHYSNIDGINGILNSQTLWLSSMCYSNDGTEHERFQENTYTYFQLCFSCGTTENLPLWFIYSHENGKGARIGFKKKSIEDLIDITNLDMELVNITTNSRTKLVHDVNCKVKFSDILYITQEGKKYRAKHNGKVNNELASQIAEKYKESNAGFFKDIIWYYEKETRLLVQVDDTLLDKNLFLNKEKAPYRIELKIPEKVFQSIDLTLSPKYSYNDFESINKILSMDGFHKAITIKSLSRYAGQIDINLCSHCKK